MTPALFLLLKSGNALGSLGLSSGSSLGGLGGIGIGSGHGFGGSGSGAGGGVGGIIPPPTPALGGGPAIHSGGVNLNYPPAPLQLPSPLSLDRAASQTWVRTISEVLNKAIVGKLNVTIDLTLTPNAAQTSIIDERLSSTTVISFCPLTANAAAELAAGTLYVSQRGDGIVVITHANNAQADREFDCSIIG